MKLGIEILALLSPSGFEKRFYKNCKSSKSYSEAYEKTEQEYESNFGKRRYSSYDSFRVTKNKKIRSIATRLDRK